MTRSVGRSADSYSDRRIRRQESPVDKTIFIKTTTVYRTRPRDEYVVTVFVCGAV